MANPENFWKPGESANPNGRPAGGKNKVQSRYRITLSRIKKLEKTSIDNLEKAVNGEEIEKQTYDASKFVINTIQSLHKAMISEEQAYKDELEKEEPEQEEEEEVKSRLSLTMVKGAIPDAEKDLKSK